VEVWHGPGVTPPNRRHAVAVGTFDGVHRGHRAVVAAALAERAPGVDVAVLTFDPHPLVVLRPDVAPSALTTLGRRLQLLAELGIDGTLVVPFTRELSELDPVAFVADYLVAGLGVATVAVGAGFRFGHRASGDVALLRKLGDEHGFAVRAVDLVGEGDPVSSTRIRAAIADGRVDEARDLLGRPHVVEGEVVVGDRRGRLLGYPTANLAVPTGIAVPPDGVYAGWLVRADGSRLPAAISVGTNPTFGPHARRVEAYVLDRDDLELYGEHVRVEFGAYLRPMVTFDGVDALLRQMADDVEETRTFVGRDLTSE
jgi:riboflavin kinase/FMN adenylyltransferase